MAAKATTPQSGEFEFSVNFNADVSGKLNFTEDQVNTSTKLSRLMCDPKRVEAGKIPAELGY